MKKTLSEFEKELAAQERALEDAATVLTRHEREIFKHVMLFDTYCNSEQYMVDINNIADEYQQIIHDRAELEMLKKRITRYN